MDRYKRMAVLAAVVESGSMSRAARELGITRSAVSQQIRQLERETRVTLLRRSTRRLTLTEAGEVLYEGCAAMLAAARAAEQRLAELRDAPVGELGISAPVGFAARHLTSALAPLLAAHRQLSLRLLVTDDRVDLIAQRIDLALTIGPPPSGSSFGVRHLADWELVICASPAYLARRGTPTSPDSLAGHDLLVLPPWHHPPDVLTGPQGQRHRLGGTARVTSNNQLSLKQLALAGFGLSLQVVPEIEEELAAGRLVRVLPEWSLPTLSVDALMAQRTKQPAKVRYALDALRAYFEQAGRRARRPLASAATTG